MKKKVAAAVLAVAVTAASLTFAGISAVPEISSTDAARAITSEGLVLLKNKNNTLPLKNGAKIALFGEGQADRYQQGSGIDTLTYQAGFVAFGAGSSKAMGKNGTVTDEIPVLTREEFDLHPPVLPLSGMFSDSDIAYTFEEYTENLRQTREFAENNKNYNVIFTEGNPFRNLQIFIHQGQWAMISKGNSPAIHFVIHHPKLRSAIENFVPPLVEKK